MSAQNERPKAISLTEAAVKRIQDIIAGSQEPVEGLRLGIKKGGCAGMEYTMDYASRAEPGEEIVEDKGIKIFIEPSALLFLLGTEMDYKVDTLSAGFVFNNPNQTSACGCGESVEIQPVSSEALKEFDKQS